MAQQFEVGDFISIPEWNAYGQVIAIEPAWYGSAAAQSVMLQERPEGAGQWYHLEPSDAVRDDDLPVRHRLTITEAESSRMSVLDLALIREAVLTVIDDGDRSTPEVSGVPIRAKDWQLYGDEDTANTARVAFCDAVANYIVSRVAPALKTALRRRAPNS